MSERGPKDSEVGEHLRELREAAGISREALAEASTLSLETIAALEDGALSPSVLIFRDFLLGLSGPLPDSTGCRGASPGRPTKDERDEGSERFGEHLRQLRETRGLSREAFAEASMLDMDTLDEIERGEGSPPLRTMRQLAMGLSMQLSELFDPF